MKITLSNWDISMAISNYLEKYYGLNNEADCDCFEIFIDNQSKNLIDEDYIKREFEKDEEWRDGKWKTLKEYELEGVYKLEKKHMRDSIDLTNEDISVWIEPEY